MAKGDRRRKKKPPLPSLAPVPPKKKRGKARQMEIDHDAPVLKMRARTMGRNEHDPYALKAMRSQRLSTPPEMAIQLAADPDDRDKLSDLYKDFSAAEERYHKSIGVSLNPQTGILETAPERFEARSDDVVDLRSQEERDRQAQTKWMEWHGILGQLSTSMREAFWAVHRGRVEPLKYGNVTMHGTVFVVALEAMLDKAE